MNPDHALLHELVATPSPTGSADKAAALLVDALRDRGFEARIDGAGNAVGSAGRGPREVMLVGHVDTVPGDWPVRLEQGVLHGRGAVDAKGPLAAFVAAATRLRDDPRVRTTVVGCIDEEGPSLGARHLLQRPAPAALVIGEPSATDGITLGYRGILRLRWGWEGDAAHTGGPEPTAADRAFAQWEHVRAALAPWQRPGLFESATPKLRALDAGPAPRGRERAAWSAEVRTPPGFDPAVLAEALAKRGAEPVEVVEACDAWTGDKNSALARAFVAAVREQGRAPRYLRKTGTSDANLLAPAWGVPCVAYGPGDAALDHTPRERLSLADFDAAVAILAGALGRWAEGAAGGERR